MAKSNWSTNEDIELLAWIDFCKKRNVRPKENTLDFMVLFRGASDRDSVKQHLTELWRKYGGHDRYINQSQLLANMMDKGSSYMSKLPDDMHEGIAIRVHKHTTAFISNTALKVLTYDGERQTVGGHLGDSAKLAGKTQGLKRSNESKEMASETLSPSKRPRQCIDEPSTPTIEKSAANRARDVQLSAKTSTYTLTDTTSGVSSNGKIVARIKPQTLPSNLPDDETNEENWRARLRSLEDKHDREIALIQELWQKEVERFGIKEVESERTIRDLKAQITHLNEARKARQEDVNDTLEARLFEDLEAIYQLRKENREMRKFATFANLNLPGSSHLGHDTIDDAMDQIQFELLSISYRRQNNPRLFPQVFEISGDLRFLIFSAFGSDIETHVGRNEVETIMRKFDAHICIRILILAALRDWVFMSRFPNLAPSDTRILSNYRQIIFSKADGKDRLCDLDLAAYRGIIEGKGFKEELLPRKATQLAARLSKALAPLFANSSDGMEDGVFHTWGEPLESWKDRRAHLQEIFQTALALKADSVVTKCRYEFEIYPIGTTFVEKSTAGKGSSGLKSGDGWIHASFHIYDAKTIVNTKEDALVQTENFVRKTSGGRDGAKYIKDLVFPKRSSEAASGRITEISASPSPEYKSAGQLNNGTEADPPQIPAVAGNHVESVKAKNSAGTEDVPNSEGSGDPPLPKCENCGKDFPAVALLRRHQKNRSCTECSECGRRFARAQTLANHHKAEHSEYRQPRREEDITELGPTRPQPSAIVSQQKSQHDEGEVAVTRDSSPRYQHNEHSKSQLVKVTKAASVVAPQTTSAQVHHYKPKQKTPECGVVDARPKCDICGRPFSNGVNLRRHMRTVCSLGCRDCQRKFANLEEKRSHQCTERKLVEEDLKATKPIPEPQTPPTSPKKIDTTASSNDIRTPTSNSAQCLDKNGKPRYKKTPRREAEDSDADDMLSPSEMVKVKRTQRRRSTKSPDGRAETGMASSQESPVRPGRQKSKPLATEE
ncbi:hypothetical protein NHQ30_000570 [Ciborinia camelliae]|nr:hypothetical protein NHQ30_000570 [Ciborinia camelliae]